MENEKNEKPAFDFKKGDLITNGKDEIGVFDKLAGLYMYFTIKCSLVDSITTIDVDTFAAFGGEWRLATDLEKKLLVGQIKSLVNLL